MIQLQLNTPNKSDTQNINEKAVVIACLLTTI